MSQRYSTVSQTQFDNMNNLPEHDDETEQLIKLVHRIDPQVGDGITTKVKNIVIRDETNQSKASDRIIQVVATAKIEKNEDIIRKPSFKKAENTKQARRMPIPLVMNSVKPDKTIFLHYDQPPRHEVINNMKDDFKEIRIIDEYEKKKKPNNEDVLDFLVVFDQLPELKKPKQEEEKPFQYVKAKVNDRNPEYKRPAGEIKIFQEPLFDGSYVRPKIEAKNELNLKSQKRDVQILSEKIPDFDNVRPKVRPFNENYTRGGREIHIVNEPLHFDNVQPKVTTYNENYEAKSHRQIQIIDEPVNFDYVRPKVRAYNENYKRGGGEVEIINEPLRVDHVKSKLSTYNDGYLFKGKNDESNKTQINLKTKTNETRVDTGKSNFWYMKRQSKV